MNVAETTFKSRFSGATEALKLEKYNEKIKTEAAPLTPISVKAIVGTTVITKNQRDVRQSRW